MAEELKGRDYETWIEEVVDLESSERAVFRGLPAALRRGLERGFPGDGYLGAVRCRAEELHSSGHAGAVSDLTRAG